VCGIAGFESRGGADDAVVERLWNSLASRGPDGAFDAEHGGYRLVQNRLAVIDLSDRVRYPMLNESRDLALLFNGEIYNFQELRAQLGRSRHEFATDCDAEVLVHGYEEWGLDLFSRLNGMFALAIADQRKRELVLARDRLGIKPLVRTTKGRFAFASDAMTLVRAGLAEPQVDLDAVRDYATFHYVPPPRTGVAEVLALEPGTAVVRSDAGHERVVRWAKPVFGGESSGESVGSLETALRAAVKRQLVADVDVGVLLSGGIDSSLVLAYAVDAGARPTAFTLGFPGSGDYDESQAARRTAKTLGVEHVVAPLELEFAGAIDAIGNAYDSPFGDASALATIAIARVARQSVTVALSGTGGDDLFGGYYRQRAHRFLPLVRMVPERVRGRIASARPAPGTERSGRLRLAASYAGRMASADPRDPRTQYLDLVTQSSPGRLHEMLRFDVDPDATATALADELGFRRTATGDFADQLQEFELATYLTGDLLVKEDRATMSVGLEGRVPLLDEEVLRVAAASMPRERMGLLKGKRALRTLAEQRFGGSLSLHKRGFAVPIASLLAGPWKESAREWLTASDSQLVDTNRLASSLGPAMAGPEVWSILCLVAWERRLRAG
jgi:asparagine synthase (glutamine-hydrolysing)